MTAIAMPKILVKADDNKIIYHLSDKGNLNEILFTGEEVTWPGKTLEKEFYISNDNDFQCYVKNLIVDGKLYDKSGRELDKSSTEYKSFLKYTKFSFSYEGKELWSGNKDELLNKNLIEKNSIVINSKEIKKFKVQFLFDKNSDNSTMKLQYKFNIQVNFSAIDAAYTPPIEKDVKGGVLVQTGSFFDTYVLTVIGVLLFALGLILYLKKARRNKI
ncbi:LPXTG-motif protein cell wall anchor domain protein [Clostridiales bacterium oral taxon 876 str. F0540]|nr:LPXTG-motif protein cell wall anchor domain protein [Clostridiales bacterium oral taxon 876 str. F0540]